MQGTAYEVPKSELEGKAIFPTVNTKNIKLEINFGKTVRGEEKVGVASHFIMIKICVVQTTLLCHIDHTMLHHIIPYLECR